VALSSDRQLQYEVKRRVLAVTLDEYPVELP
jgi:hypothetical protein